MYTANTKHDIDNLVQQDPRKPLEASCCGYLPILKIKSPPHPVIHPLTKERRVWVWLGFIHVVFAPVQFKNCTRLHEKLKRAHDDRWEAADVADKLRISIDRVLPYP